MNDSKNSAEDLSEDQKFINPIDTCTENQIDTTDCDKKLLDAITKNNIRLIKQLILQGCDINKKFKSGSNRDDSPFRYAIHYCDTNTLKFMIENGANPNQVLNRRMTPTHDAAGLEFPKFNLLVRNGGNVDLHVKDVNFPTPLIWAIHNNRIENIKLLLELNISIDPDSTNGYTSALSKAMYYGKFEIVDLLLDHGVDLNAKFSEPHSGDCFCCPFEITVLHSLVLNFSGSKNKEELKAVLNKFIDKGANIDAKNEFGLTPLDFAIHSNQIELVKFFIKHGSTIKDGINCAAMTSNFEMVEFLLKKGANPNNISKVYNSTPLIDCMTCCGDGMGEGISLESRIKTTKLLINAGADPHYRDNFGKTFVDYCKDRNSEELNNMIKELNLE